MSCSNRARGATAYDFTGRLSFSWPATAMPVTFEGSQVKGAQFARGFGLTLPRSQDLADLPEDPQIAPAYSDRDSLFNAGHVTAPWSIYVSDPSAEVRLTLQSQVSPAGAITAQLSGQSVQATWSGQGPGVFRIGGRATSLTKALADGQVLKLHYRVEQPPQKPVILSTALRAGRALWNGAKHRAGPHGNLPERRHRRLEDADVPLACPEKAGRNAVLRHGTPGDRERRPLRR